uniref:Uncharacterized protein n=1 Tax=Cacopsylla melanoneura TaxID=428564 RepID=A0A8D8S4W3_9HEMI
MTCCHIHIYHQRKIITGNVCHVIKLHLFRMFAFQDIQHSSSILHFIIQIQNTSTSTICDPSSRIPQLALEYQPCEYSYFVIIVTFHFLGLVRFITSCSFY